MGEKWQWIDFKLTTRSYARHVAKMLNERNLEQQGKWQFKTAKSTIDDGKGNWYGLMR